MYFTMISRMRFSILNKLHRILAAARFTAERGIRPTWLKLEHQLNILILFTLVSGIVAGSFFTPVFPNARHKVPVASELPSLKLFLNFRVFHKYVLSDDAFLCRYNLRRAVIWCWLDEKMYMVFISAHFQKTDPVIP